ncbi:MAG TPA: diaminopimelate epimerase [Opitutae bacterium]|nr:diaminopimelate epimerase [Opitutae bacterium]
MGAIALNSSFYQYDALGNVYLVLDARQYTLAGVNIAWVCEQTHSDGLLYGPLPSKSDCAVRIFNSDGSEAEKSGNGLRIFAAFMKEHGQSPKETLQIETIGGLVTCTSVDGQIMVDMGIPSAISQVELIVAEKTFDAYTVSIGNPHCVCLCKSPTRDMARQYGPLIESHALFPKKTNVQFVEQVDSQHFTAEIWERGSGYTLSSGSSACAIVAVARSLQLCESRVWVSMPGGVLEVNMGTSIAIAGPVRFLKTFQMG